MNSAAKVYAWCIAACFHIRGFQCNGSTQNDKGCVQKAMIKQQPQDNDGQLEVKLQDRAALFMLPIGWVSGRNQDVFNFVFDHPDLMGTFSVKCIVMMGKMLIFQAKLTRVDLEESSSTSKLPLHQHFQFKLAMETKRVRGFQDLIQPDLDLVTDALDVNVFQKLDVGLSPSFRIEVDHARTIFDFVVTQWSPNSREQLLVLAAHSILIRDGFFFSTLLKQDDDAVQYHPALLPENWRDRKSFTFEYAHAAYQASKVFLIKFMTLDNVMVVSAKQKDSEHDELSRKASIMWKFNMNRFVEKGLDVYTASCFRGFSQFVTMVSNGISKRLVTPEGRILELRGLTQLPVELLVHMLMFLDSKSLVNMELTSGVFKSIASSSSIWKHLCGRELGVLDLKFNRRHWKTEFISRYVEKLSQEQRERAVRERWGQRLAQIPRLINPLWLPRRPRFGNGSFPDYVPWRPEPIWD
eukprot:TRINITY_DN19474_c0_g1_i1.p1 TRINITY_DN19474_c0_g1~~TRINITY_DN19474_c0_g1_i1.p1  ORF type:complete len:505 (+),score=101.23 TRINITY_DN19474_c0_g1_i1:115-1515(+)